jgi:3-hydroxybutyryl-CoA dehydrogenase
MSINAPPEPTATDDALAAESHESRIGCVGVVGAGTMGRGVAQLFAEAGYQVVVTDVTERALADARDEIRQGARLAPLTRGVRLDVDDLLGRLEFTTELSALRAADYVIENVPEKWEVKVEVYQQLDEVCRPDCVFGVNTSAISITRVASVTGRAPEVIGTHFMNPAPMKPTVEVIRGHWTSDRTLAITRSLLEKAGKSAVVVNDSPGFVTNRVLMLTINEAIFLVHEGVAAVADVDRLFKECFGHKMGPLETADLIGLDTVLYSLEVLYEAFNDPKYRPSTLLRRLVDAGLHGRKTGYGFYPYEQSDTAETRGSV